MGAGRNSVVFRSTTSYLRSLSIPKFASQSAAVTTPLDGPQHPSLDEMVIGSDRLGVGTGRGCTFRARRASNQEVEGCGEPVSEFVS